jgi:hypothetical protein
MVTENGTKVMARDAEADGSAEETSGGADEEGTGDCEDRGTEEVGRVADIAGTRLIGFRIRPGISLSE